jgi:hypothetical protein
MRNVTLPILLLATLSACGGADIPSRTGPQTERVTLDGYPTDATRYADADGVRLIYSAPPGKAY